jgi:hypothetical protein
MLYSDVSRMSYSIFSDGSLCMYSQMVGCVVSDGLQYAVVSDDLQLCLTWFTLWCRWFIALHDLKFTMLSRSFPCCFGWFTWFSQLVYSLISGVYSDDPYGLQSYLRCLQ